MSKRWGSIVAYTGAMVVQIALLGAAWYVQQLTTEKMMVMRYFLAKNLLAEQHIFSPTARVAQAAVLAIISAGALAAAVRWLLVRQRGTAVRAFVAAVLAAGGAKMLLLMSAEQTRGLYVLVAAVWIALVIQLLVVFASARSAKRNAS